MSEEFRNIDSKDIIEPATKNHANIIQPFTSHLGKAEGYNNYFRYPFAMLLYCTRNGKQV
jgi:hypothetical protein